MPMDGVWREKGNEDMSTVRVDDKTRRLKMLSTTILPKYWTTRLLVFAG